MRTDSHWRGLVADIGGTNARLAIASIEGGVCVLHAQERFRVADYADFNALFDAFIRQHPEFADERLDAAIAVAGPVSDNRAELTNINRIIDGGRLVADGLFEACLLVNDFAALAASLPLLQPEDLSPLATDKQPEGPTRLVVGPGTGLGAAYIVRMGGRYMVLPGEGGHAAFAPFDELEEELLRWFLRRYPERVSWERILSGRGLEELHLALRQIDGHAPQNTQSLQRLEAKRITAAALAGDEQALRAWRRFFAILGGFAGDLALIGGAWGGVYIGGGMAPRVEKLSLGRLFQQRFEAKGRFRDKAARIPTHLITTPDPALIGAAFLAAEG